jgi:hypothetical protein
VPGYAFISYSHYDAREYVDRLVAHLADSGIAVWYDKELITGDRWARVIEQKLIAAAAVIAVMTPAGADSKWVDLELDKAEDLGLPIFPLLVQGDRFFRLHNVQYLDLRPGQLPSAEFARQLHQLAATPADLPAPPPDGQRVGLQRRYDHAVQVGDTGRPARAAAILADLIAEQTRILGSGAPETLQSRDKHALYRGRAGDWAEAVRLYRELIPDRTRILGYDHPGTLTSRHSLAWAIGQAGNWAEAARLYRDVIPDRASTANSSPTSPGSLAPITPTH